MSELKPKHGEWWLGKWSGTDFNTVMQYSSNTNQWHKHGVEAFETEHSFKPVNRLYGKAEVDLLERENTDLKEILKSLLAQAKSSAERRHIFERDEFEWAVNRLNEITKVDV